MAGEEVAMATANHNMDTMLEPLEEDPTVEEVGNIILTVGRKRLNMK